LQHRVGLRHAGLRGLAARAAQPGQARRGLPLAGAGLIERGVQLLALQPHQRVALAHRGAFGHQHLAHAAGERAAQLDTRRGGHTRGEEQRAHQRRRLHHRRRNHGRTREPPREHGGKNQRRSGQREHRSSGHGVHCFTSSWWPA
jgi:hypothetical protein